MLGAVVQVLVGVVALIASGDAVVRGSVGLALKAGLPRAAVGATIVAIGTSLPELFVSVNAARQGLPDLAVGNVVGSNIYNIGLILGIAALIHPLTTGSNTRRIDGPFALGAAVAALAFGWDGVLGPLEGAVMLSAYVAYLGLQFGTTGGEEVSEEETGGLSPAFIALYLLGGVPVLTISADLVVSGATALAENAGVSRRVIGLTVLAVGTSLPELTASTMAAWRGEGDIAISNVLGSNVFNVLGICGVTSLILPLTVSPSMREQDMPVMIAMTAGLLVVLAIRTKVDRGLAPIFLLAVVAYTAWLLVS